MHDKEYFVTQKGHSADKDLRMHARDTYTSECVSMLRIACMRQWVGHAGNVRQF